MRFSMEAAGYKRLEISQRAHRLAVEVHRITLHLPKFELFEEGGQVRRSSKSVAAQIVEGYCLRRNKAEFVQYLNRAYASAHETIEHLSFLDETGSFGDKAKLRELESEYEILCRMIFRFLEGVIEGHEKPGFVREEVAAYETRLTSPIPNPTSG
jgi:four helix bundle protein